MANFTTNSLIGVTLFLVSMMACLRISTSEATANSRSQTVSKLPWEVPPPSIPPPSPDSKGPATPTGASMNPNALQAMVELRQIVFEGIPFLLKLYRVLTTNIFAKPLYNVLLTCDKLDFMVSCLPQIIEKVRGALSGAGEMNAQYSSSKEGGNDERESSEVDEFEEDEKEQGEVNDDLDQWSVDQDIDGEKESEIQRSSGESVNISETTLQDEDEEATELSSKHQSTPLGPDLNRKNTEL